VTFNNIELVAYLYEPLNAAIASGATCTFKIFRVQPPNWSEVLIATVNGSVLLNGYFYANPTLASLAPINFFGGDSIMIEATIIRLGVTYRDRVYINHLGIYDNVTRLRQDVEWLDISKLDE